MDIALQLYGIVMMAMLFGGFVVMMADTAMGFRWKAPTWLVPLLVFPPLISFFGGILIALTMAVFWG